MNRTMYSRICGTGSALPARVVSNEALVRELAGRGIETSDEWIATRTGIRQRHIAEPGVGTTDLAARAAVAALERAGFAADTLDLIVVATSTSDQVFPSTACSVQARIGAGARRRSTSRRPAAASCTAFPWRMP